MLVQAADAEVSRVVQANMGVVAAKLTRPAGPTSTPTSTPTPKPAVKAS